MPSTPSHRPQALQLVSAAGPRATVTRLHRTVPPDHTDGGFRRRSARADAGRRIPHDCHLLVVGGAETSDRRGIAAHTGGLIEHLAGRVASVSLLAAGARSAASDGPGGDGGWRRAGDELGFLTGALTTALPRVPDVVIGVTPGLGGAVAAARIARRHRVPLVLIAHDLVSARPDRSGGRGLTVAAATERRLLRSAAEVAVVGPELAGHVHDLGIGPEHVYLVPHWAPEGFEPADRNDAREALGWPLRPFTVVLAAAGTRPDLATVQAAAALLPDEAQLVVLGDGTRHSAVPAQGNGPGRIRRIGPLADGEYLQALAAADLLLLADRSDATGLPLPGTLAAYLAAGRPVLAATAEGGSVAAELDRTAGAGLVVRPGDPRLLAAAIRALLADRPLRAAMGLTARRYAVERLDRAGTMRQLDAMLRSAVGATIVDLTTA